MKFIILITAFVAGVTLLSPTTRAQQSTDSPNATAIQPSVRAELVAKIEKLKYAKMKTALALDDATATQFFEIYKPAEKDIQAIVKDRNEEMKKLALMMNGAKSDADVDPAMQKIRELNQQITDREQKLDNDLKPILSPRQRAKLLVFEHEFNQRVREQIANGNGQGENKNSELRALRSQLREQRLKNRLLQKQAEKDAEVH
jgi:Spy/CpxP family protein refolding chaperone